MILRMVDCTEKSAKKISIYLSLFLLATTGLSQTPGMIFENRGILVLDPNGDGYISKTSAGFTTFDKFASKQSEISYVPFAVIQSEPTSDPGPGPNCSFNDFDDIREYGEPMYTYFDNSTPGGPYLLYRFRLSDYSPNSKSYSVFIDVDGRFGNSGPNADPNYTAYNPGFEIEIYLATNFGVGIYNIDGIDASTSSTDPANISASSGTYPYASYSHKAIAWPYPGGSCDASGTEYFYDFYIPFSAVQALTFSGQTAINIGNAHVSSSTPMRMIGATVMNPNPGFGNTALSDFGGVNDSAYGSLANMWQDMVDVFPPTSPDQINTIANSPTPIRLTPRSDCPLINTPSTGSTTIIGSSTESNGTNITVYVSANLNFSPVTIYTTTVNSGAWSVTVPALTAGYYVKATAQNPGTVYGTVTLSESESYDNCDIETVVACGSKTAMPTNVTGTKNKGFTGSGITGATIMVYDPSSALQTANPAGTETVGYMVGTFANSITEFCYKCNGGGNCNSGSGTSCPNTNGVYTIIQKESGKCASDPVFVCIGTASSSTTPTITTASLTSSSTSIAGANGINGATIYVYANGYLIGSKILTAAGVWTVTGLTFSACQVISVKQVEPSKCEGVAVSTLTVTNNQASAPAITGSYCVGAASTIFVTGTSAEADGATIKIYKTGPTLIGTTTVNNNAWSMTTTGTVLSGNSIWATAENTTLPCQRSVSANSASKLIGSSSPNTGLTVDATVEGATTVTGHAPVTAGTYTIKLYIDGYNDPSWVATGVSGGASATYTITPIAAGIIYAGADLYATANDGTNCESQPSSSVEVTCNTSVISKLKASSVTNSPICSGSNGIIGIANSQQGIYYQLYDITSLSDVGVSSAGNGSTVYLQTQTLSNPAIASRTYKIKAIRTVPTTSQCYSFLDADSNGDDQVTVNVSTSISPSDLSITYSPSPASVCSGQTVSIELLSSQSGVNYQLFNNMTGVAISSVAPGSGGDITLTTSALTSSLIIKVNATSGSCTRDLSELIGVSVKALPLATASNNGPVCEGAALSLTGGPVGNTYSWSGPSFTSSSMSPIVSASATPLMSGTYNLTVTGSNGCTSTASTTATVTTNNPNISITDASTSEGNSGTKNLNFTVSLSAAACSNIIINYATSDGPATTADGDYTSISGSITINAGNTTGTISVPVIGDVAIEGDQTFSVTLTAPTAGTLTDAVAIGTIQEDDSTPTVTLSGNNATISEAAGVCTFTATLSSVSAVDVTIQLSASGSATGGGADYTLSSTSITIVAGNTTGSITVTAVNDNIYESATNETIVIDISSVVNASENGVQQASTEIIDNDSQSTISIDDVSVAEGSNLVFTISLSNASYQTIAVNYATADGTATTADNDYTAMASTGLTFNPGETTKTVTISTTTDTKYETDETVNIGLSGASNATITDATGLGTITNNDNQPTVSLGIVSGSIAENAGSTLVTATLSNTSYQNVSVNLSFGGTAIGSGTDYSVSGTSIVIPAGLSSGTVTIISVSDIAVEGGETIIVDISMVNNALEDIEQQVTTTIDDDDLPNQLPSAADDIESVNEDSNASTNVAINDTGLGDDGLVVTVTSGPAHGVISISGTTVTYTPSANYNGPDSYTYQICDADNDCSAATVNITVSSVDDFPSAADDIESVNEDSNVGTNVAINDTGLGDGGLVVTVTSGPAHGVISISGTTVTYIPSANYNGPDSYTYQICDTDNDCSTATVNITVNSVDDFPSAADDNASVNEDSNASTNVAINDTGLGDGGLVVTVTSGPAHGAISISGTTVTYTPSANYNGPDSYTYQICDADNDCSTATVNITVNSVDDLPVANNDNISALENTAVNLHELSNDTGLGDDGLVVTISITPSHGTAKVEADNTITYTPSTGYLGGDSYTYQLCDADGDCSAALVTIIVDNVDDVPLANIDAFIISEDEVSIFDVLSNDSGLADGGLVVTIGNAAKHGIIIVNANNTITYAPDANFFGKDSIIYQVCDVDNDCSNAKTLITVNNVNDLPSAIDDNIIVNEDSNIATDVAANDSGLGDEGLVVNVIFGPTHGSTIITGTTITYTPSANYYGTDSYTYQICDGDGDCSSAIVYIGVNNIDDIPLAVNDNVSVNEDSNNATNVATNDTGLGDGSLEVTVTSGPSHGSITISGTTITFTPDADYHGADSYTYQICDVDGDCSSAIVNITVTSIDDIPVANNDNISTLENTGVNLHELSNDTGLGDGGLVVTINGAPLHGTAVVEADNTITYIPSFGYLGNDSYTYQVCDGDADCVTAIVNIIVDNTDDVPSAVADAVTVNEDASSTFDVLTNDTGLTDGGLSVTLLTDAMHGSAFVKIDNTITYESFTDYFGMDSLVYQVCDVDGDCTTAKVLITVNNVDDQPTAVDDNITVNEDTNISIDPTLNDNGLGDGGLVVTVPSGPSHGTVSIIGKTVIYDPAADYYGSDSFTYQLCDADGDCVEGTVSIIINNVNDIPVANNDAYSGNESQSGTIDVLANDTGLGDGGTVVSITVNGKHATAIVNIDKTITYTPTTGYFGKDTIIYQVCDINNECSTAQVIINFNSTNQAPTAIPVENSVTTLVNSPVEICFTTNDTDGDQLTSSPVVMHGTIMNSINTNCFIYTPTADYTGKDTLRVTWCDPESVCVTAVVSISVSPVALKPLAKADTLYLQTTIGREVSGCIEMITNTTGLTVTIIETPDYGVLRVENQLCIKYQPTGDFYGILNVPVAICNPEGMCDTVIVYVDIIPVKVPHGFSPNGDDLNEKFEIEGLELYDKVSIQVFNRWGNEVYKSEVYKNDWDGASKNSFTLGGSKLPAGTYFYVVDFHNGKKPLVGYVYLSR